MAGGLLLLPMEMLIIVDGCCAATAAVGNAGIALSAIPLSMLYNPGT